MSQPNPEIAALRLGDEITWEPTTMHHQWTKISVYRHETPTNVWGAVQYRRCYWCGRDSHLIVERVSAFSGHTYSDNACATCAEKWLPENERKALP